MRRAHGDTDRRPDLDIGAGKIELLGQRVEHAARDPRRLVGVVQLGKQHREFIAGQSSDQRLGDPVRRGNAVGDRAQPVGDHPE